MGKQITTYSIKTYVSANIPTSVRIENVGLDKKLNGTEGQNLIIRCSAVGGDPPPDVNLKISESTGSVAKQYVQLTLIPLQRFHDGQIVGCLAGYGEMSYYPLNDSARIYLKCKKIIDSRENL